VKVVAAQDIRNIRFHEGSRPSVGRGRKKACEGGASRITGSGVEVTSLRMQNMSSGVTVGVIESGAGEKGPAAF
jgi:hypothetical protein